MIYFWNHNLSLKVMLNYVVVVFKLLRIPLYLDPVTKCWWLEAIQGIISEKGE